MNGISVRIKEAPERSLALSTTTGGHTTWEFQPPELGKINVCCLQATQLVVFCYRSLDKTQFYMIKGNM